VKSPRFARLMLDAGARGVCVAKLGEAEVMAAAGIEDILITTELAGSVKLARLVALLRRHDSIKLVVDSPAGVAALASALGAAGLTARVLLDLDVGQRRSGVLPGEPALELARQIAATGVLQLVGVQGYEGHLQHVPDAAERERKVAEAMARLTSTAAALRDAGHDIRVVTTGGTGTALFCLRHPGITEVQPGSFVFMDTSYRRVLGAAYEHALVVSATVLGRPRAGEAVIDAGLKSLSTDMGFAEPAGLPGVSYRPAGDEHGILSWDASTTDPALDVGARVLLWPSHIDTTINLFDEYHVHRGGSYEGAWPVSARGKVQ
jgi:D-serine deaminase-like pyridoxal phosphate-dependent protein